MHIVYSCFDALRKKMLFRSGLLFGFTTNWASWHFSATIVSNWSCFVNFWCHFVLFFLTWRKYVLTLLMHLYIYFFSSRDNQLNSENVRATNSCSSVCCFQSVSYFPSTDLGLCLARTHFEWPINFQPYITCLPVSNRYTQELTPRSVCFPLPTLSWRPHTWSVVNENMFLTNISSGMLP